MPDNALEKIERARRGIDELGQSIRDRRPFRQIFEMNKITGACKTYADTDDAAIAEVTSISFDVIQNLRTSLDYAYWPIVSPFAKNESTRSKIQFPFANDAEHLERELLLRSANLVSPAFSAAILAMAPHGGVGGNQFLYLIHKLARHDRHRFPTPVADFKTLTRLDLQRQGVPGFPMQDLRCGANGGDVSWMVASSPPIPGWAVLAEPFIVKREIDVSVDVTINFDGDGSPQSLIHTLHRMAREAEVVVAGIRTASM